MIRLSPGSSRKKKAPARRQCSCRQCSCRQCWGRRPSRTGRVRPVIAGNERLSRPRLTASTVKQGRGGKRGGTAVCARRSGHVVLAARALATGIPCHEEKSGTDGHLPARGRV